MSYKNAAARRRRRAETRKLRYQRRDALMRAAAKLADRIAQG